jgi:hypothetical protein
MGRDPHLRQLILGRRESRGQQYWVFVELKRGVRGAYYVVNDE